MATVATNLRRGQVINHKGEKGVLLEVEHRMPGKGHGYVQVIMRSLQTNKSKDIRFISGDKVEIMHVDRRKLEFSYQDHSGYHFMDVETYEMIFLPEELIGEGKDYLIENLPIDVNFIEESPVSIDLPPSINLKVTISPDAIRGDTANNPQKTITLETGKTILAPLFIKEGDIVKVETKSGKYMGRAT